MTVGQLAIILGVQLDRRSVAVAQGALGSIGRMAMGIAGAFGARHLGKAMIGFNSNVENAKLQVASMLALAKGTGVSEQLVVANEQYEKIRKAAAELPGSTEEYVNALGRMTYPLTKAGFSLDKIRELTVNTVVAAKGIGITSVAASIRDVQQALEGRFSSTDLFLKSLLEPMGYEGEKGRAKFKALSKEKRAEVLNEALTQKAIVESAKLQAQTFSGRMDKAKEATAQFLGRIGLPLFQALSVALKHANKWLEKNEQKLKDVAETVGGVLVAAFEGIEAAIEWLIEHEDAAIAMVLGLAGALTFLAGRAALAWIATMGPFAAIVGIIGGAIYLFLKLRDSIGDVGAAIVAAFAAVAIWKTIAAVKTLVTWMWGLKAATAGSNVAGAAANAAGAAGAMTRTSALAQAGAAAVPGAAGAGAFAAGAGARGAGAAGAAGTAAKAGGAGLLSLLGPIGWGSMLGMAANSTGGTVLDRQAEATGYQRNEDDSWVMNLMKTAAWVDKGKENASAATAITNGPTTVNIYAKDMADAEAKFAKAGEDLMAAQLRSAKRATSGNR